jgi:LacI family transcriptional regulator
VPRLQYSRSDDDEEPRIRRAGIRDVAQLAGVAVSSASRVLSDHPDVSPAMRRRVLDAVAQLGYEPDFLAQSLRRGATYTIGFVTRDISSPLLAEIALGAERALRAAAYTMLVLNSEGDPVLDARHLRLLERRRTDGLLVSLADESHPEALAALRALTVPAVLIDRDVAEAPGLGAVLADHEGGMRAVVSHLASLGHRVVGLAAGPTQVRPGREAARAFREFCGDFGIAARTETGPFEAGYGFDAANRMLDAPDAPTALIAGSNQIFPGVFRAVRERGLRIPQQLSLVTFDDQPLLGLLSPPIDVVRRGPQSFGQTAAEQLLRQLRGEQVSSLLVPTVFERRGSSAPPPQR